MIVPCAGQWFQKDVDMVTNMYAKAENCVFDLVVVSIAFVISGQNNNNKNNNHNGNNNNGHN